jgi:hypothetical protein
MANITSPQVVAWANGRARTISDSIRQMYDKLKSYQTDYVAESVNAAIVADPAGSTAVIADGSAADGRQSITGTQIQNLIACINQVVTAMDTTNVTGVGSPPMTTANAIQVNGSVK